MRLVIALGGNALQQRDEPLTLDTQWKNARIAARALEPVVRRHQVLLTHGNGPQVGLLAMQAQSFEGAEPYSFDIMGAATEGMIGYILEQELGNLLGYDVPVSTLLTRVEVSAEDPEFDDPSKFVGPVFDQQTAEALAARHGWTFRQDGARWRRVVPSPQPQRILWHRPIRWLLDQGAVVICAGGGGIPVIRRADGQMEGTQAVIDKDRASALLATRLPADLFVIATDVEGVFEGFGTPAQRLVRECYADEVEGEFARGSMGPKVEAALNFVRATGRPAAIGALNRIGEIVEGTSGTRILPRESRAA